jgi:hypothetical protein
MAARLARRGLRYAIETRRIKKIRKEKAGAAPV